ncbi:MAG: hypothetical protein OH354_01520 [Candidatus Parvarchaeota archaeon]|nr:hypothetical protein [Candidatus Jingweiarchaeum tengchongense]MCW1300081.1 hypothetical protein [Candidatus Jingweiarchaeum tengchongense]MCW1304435.1 hypothetical protein [Candidatus Jingweiarchaeum tengchongense]MCW1305602.1 hypothetical protein [Candidatus Jingweiarchaeum tengchongense]MCW1310983.1 hypothetical protein [Candidatus Jingweiarchaeum tengchongense]
MNKKAIVPIIIVLLLGVVVIGSFIFVLSRESNEARNIVNKASKKFNETESLSLDGRMVLKIHDPFTENVIELEFNLSRKNGERKSMKVINISKDFSFEEISNMLFKIARMISGNKTQENYTIPCEVFSYEEAGKVIDCARGNISDVSLGCIGLDELPWNCSTSTIKRKDILELLNPDIYKYFSSLPLIEIKYLGNKTIAEKNCEKIGFYYNPIGIKKLGEIIYPNATKFMPDINASICFESEHGILLESIIRTGSEAGYAEGYIIIERVDYVNVTDLEIPAGIK